MKKVAVFTVTKLLFYKIPDAVAQSVPISVLCGAILSLLRLGKDSELLALRTGGIRVLRLLLPLLALGFMASIIVFALNEHIVPQANHEFENIVRKIILQEALPSAEEDVFFKGTGDRFFYIRKVDASSRTLKDVLVYEIPKEGLPRIITAKTGKADGDVWTLSDGMVHDLDSDGYVIYEARFGEMSLHMDEKHESFIDGQKTPDEMNRKELKSYIDLFQTGGMNVTSLVVDYKFKLALPFAAFIFALTGAPLAVAAASPKTGRFTGIVISGCIAFAYYAFSSILRSLGCSHILSPFIAAWSGNIVFVFVGIALIIRSEHTLRSAGI